MLTAKNISPRHSIVGLPDQQVLQFQWDLPGCIFLKLYREIFLCGLCINLGVTYHAQNRSTHINGNIGANLDF